MSRASREIKLDAERILLRDHHGILGTNVPAVPITAIAVSAILLTQVPAVRLVIAAALIIGSAPATLYLWRQVDRNFDDWSNEKIRRNYGHINAIGGVGWGFYFLIAMPEAVEAQLFLASIIPLAMVVNLFEAASVPRSFLHFHVPFAVLTTLAYALAAEGSARWAAPLFAVAAIYLGVLARAQHAQAEDRAALSVRNAELIEDLNELNEDLRRQSAQDRLTGLANRRALEHFMQLSFGRWSVGDGELVALFIDLDHFKQINDQHGHHTGDELLVQVAKRVHRLAPKGACTARVGGDEIVMVLADQHSVDLGVDLAQRVVSAIAEPFRLSEGTVRIGASVGVAITNTNTEGENGQTGDLDELLRRADRALYRAKTKGGSTVALAACEDTGF